jgi:hypothetical protein
MKDNDKARCLCRKMGCWRGDDKGIPSYCQANHYLKEIEQANKAYARTDVVDIYSAACFVGLCMGHDILFTRYSRAPVSTLIVKDRLMGNNPAAAIYGWHARRSLFKLRRSDDEIV